MFLKQQIEQDLKNALKNKQPEKTAVLRMLNSAIKNKEIEFKKRDKGLSDEQVIEVIAQQAKQRKDSIEQFKKGGRNDLVKQEKLELEILEKYLPEQLSVDEIKKIVKQCIGEGADNIGAVMGQVMPQVKGKADGAQVKQIVEQELKKH